MADNRGQYLLKNTVIFSIGNLGTKVISFFLVPLYTTALSTAQYGTVDLVATISTLMASVLALNISEAVMRFALDENADQTKIMSVGISVLLFASVMGTLLIALVKKIPEIQKYTEYLYFYMISLVASQIFLCYLRGTERLIFYSIGNIVHTLSIAVLNILFLVFLRKGIVGYFKAYILSNIITIVYAFVVGHVGDVLKHFKFDVSLAKTMISYSIVLIPNSFMWWITDSSDRLLITAILGASANGLYAIACKIPTILSSFSGIFSQAWMYSAIREESSVDKEQYTNMVYNGLFGILLILAAGVLLVLKPFMRHYVDATFFDAWQIVPYLIIGFVFSALSTFLGTSYTVHKDSKGYLLSAMCGAVVNVCLNCIFIPLFGCVGAAIATSISYISVFMYRLRDTGKYIKIKTTLWRNKLGLILVLVDVVLMAWDLKNTSVVLLVNFIAVLCLFSDVWINILQSVFRKSRG